MPFVLSYQTWKLVSIEEPGRQVQEELLALAKEQEKELERLAERTNRWV